MQNRQTPGVTSHTTSGRLTRGKTCTVVIPTDEKSPERQAIETNLRY